MAVFLDPAHEEYLRERVLQCLVLVEEPFAMTDHVQKKALVIISEDTGSTRGALALLEELTDTGCIADAFRTVKQAKAAGLKSGMLRSGDTFGKDF